MVAPAEKVERANRQAALDLREVGNTKAGQRVLARLLTRAGTYGPIFNKRDVGRRDFGLRLERDVLRACGAKVWLEIQRIRLTELPSTELVHRTGDSSTS